jgi:hypothetical protein
LEAFMTARQLLATCGLGLVALTGTPLLAQGPYVSQRMYVVIKLNPNQDPWDLATRMSSTAAMPLVGISPSTNSAVFTVPNETDMNNGTVANRNEDLLLKQFGSAIVSYNYGQNYPIPTDLQQNRPTTSNNYDQRGYGYRRYNNNREFRLNNRDRQAVQDWYDRSHQQVNRPVRGNTLDQTQRNLSTPAPADLVRMLPQAPSDYRFLIIDKSLVVVDSRDVIQDVVDFDR